MLAVVLAVSVCQGIAPDEREYARAVAETIGCVELLGSERWRDREDAHRKLLRIASCASMADLRGMRYVVYEAMLNSPDHEVRARCSLIHEELVELATKLLKRVRKP